MSAPEGGGRAQMISLRWALAGRLPVAPPHAPRPNPPSLAALPFLFFPSSRQLAPGTHVVVDETVMAPGRLSPLGIASLEALRSVALSQTLPFDFGEGKRESRRRSAGRRARIARLQANKRQRAPRDRP